MSAAKKIRTAARQLPQWLVNIYALESLRWYLPDVGRPERYAIICDKCSRLAAPYATYEHPDVSEWDVGGYIDDARLVRARHARWCAK